MLKQLGPDPYVQGWRVDKSEILVSVMLGGLIKIVLLKSICRVPPAARVPVLGTRLRLSLVLTLRVIMAAISEMTTICRYVPRYAGPAANHTKSARVTARLLNSEPVQGYEIDPR